MSLQALVLPLVLRAIPVSSLSRVKVIWEAEGLTVVRTYMGRRSCRVWTDFH